jgi:hypothetical protein
MAACNRRRVVAARSARNRLGHVLRIRSRSKLPRDASVLRPRCRRHLYLHRTDRHQVRAGASHRRRAGDLGNRCHRARTRHAEHAGRRVRRNRGRHRSSVSRGRSNLPREKQHRGADRRDELAIGTHPDGWRGHRDRAQQHRVEAGNHQPQRAEHDPVRLGAPVVPGDGGLRPGHRCAERGCLAVPRYSRDSPTHRHAQSGGSEQSRLRDLILGSRDAAALADEEPAAPACAAASASGPVRDRGELLERIRDFFRLRATD